MVTNHSHNPHHIYHIPGFQIKAMFALQAFFLLPRFVLFRFNLCFTEQMKHKCFLYRGGFLHFLLPLWSSVLRSWITISTPVSPADPNRARLYTLSGGGSFGRSTACSGSISDHPGIIHFTSRSDGCTELGLIMAAPQVIFGCCKMVVMLMIADDNWFISIDRACLMA